MLEGLEGAAAGAAAGFDRGTMEETIAGLGKRVFLMNNVHEDEPVIFQTRWTLSYLAGPITPVADPHADGPGEGRTAGPAG